jgi:hypothetical protein
MTDDEVRTIQTRVTSFLDGQDGRGLDVGNPSHFAQLVGHAGAGFVDIAEDDMRMVVAMCWIGPHSAGDPPTPMRHDLRSILRRCVTDERERIDRVMEFVIAYGCGRWRDVQPGGGGWEHRWPGALRGLVRALEPAVAQTNRWLAEHVVRFPQNRGVPQDKNFPEDTAVWSDAWLLATRLVRPEYCFSLEEQESLSLTCVPEGTDCTSSTRDYRHTIFPGAKAIWTVQGGEGVLLLPNGQSRALAAGTTVILIARDEDTIIKTAKNEHSQQIRISAGEEANLQGPKMLLAWECTCGTTHCQERHRLHSWDPLQTVRTTGTKEGSSRKEEKSLTLWDFVASAVKGPQLRIQTGSFVQGLYFPLLAQEGCTQ